LCRRIFTVAFAVLQVRCCVYGVRATVLLRNLLRAERGVCWYAAPATGIQLAGARLHVLLLLLG
jgi:hypothetical protein